MLSPLSGIFLLDTDGLAAVIQIADEMLGTGDEVREGRNITIRLNESATLHDQTQRTGFHDV